MNITYSLPFHSHSLSSPRSQFITVSPFHFSFLHFDDGPLRSPGNCCHPSLPLLLPHFTTGWDTSPALGLATLKMNFQVFYICCECTTNLEIKKNLIHVLHVENLVFTYHLHIFSNLHQQRNIEVTRIQYTLYFLQKSTILKYTALCLMRLSLYIKHYFLLC